MSWSKYGIAWIFSSVRRGEEEYQKVLDSLNEVRNELKVINNRSVDLTYQKAGAKPVFSEPVPLGEPIKTFATPVEYRQQEKLLRSKAELKADQYLKESAVVMGSES